MQIKTGKEIVIELNEAAEEVTHIAGHRIAPTGVKVYNPAFDVTPAKLISAIITEREFLNFLMRENLVKRKQETGPW